MEVKWTKLDVGLFDNRKIKQIRTLPEGDSIIIIWLQLICLAGTTNDGGKIYLTDEIPYTDQMLSTALNEPLATVQLALATFEKFGMIDVVDEIIYLRNWEKYQAVEELDRIREQNRIRQKRWYDSHKEIPNVIPNGGLTEPNTDLTEQNKNKKENKNKNKNIYFIPPTIEEAREYFVSLSYTDSEADRFYDYYTSNGWKVGKGKMKDWKAAARNWMRNEKSWKQPSRSKLPDFENINGYHELDKKGPQMTPEEAKDWYDNLIKELEAEDGNTSK